VGGQPEGRLARAVIKMVVERGGYAWKQHGNEYQPAGLPDVLGVYKGIFVGFETKMPGNEKPSAVQVYRARQIRKAGGLVCSPCLSVPEATEMLDLADRAQHNDDAYFTMMRKYGQLAGGKTNGA
jgi:hypothetical protein